MGATAILDSSTLSVDPGGDAVCTLRVQNTGQVVDQFTIDIVGDAAAFASVESPVLNLLPGHEEATRVHFRPPREPATRAGEVVFGVRVSSREDPQGSTVEEGILSVGGFTAAAAELVPRNARGRRRASFELALDNLGNLPLRATAVATDPDNLLRFEIDPATITAPPGASGFARVRARARSSFWNGPPRSRPFALEVQPEGQAPIKLDGVVTQVSLLAGWVLPALGVLAALVIAALLFWFLVLKPTIQTAAKDAVAQQAAQQQPAPQPSNPQSGGGGGTPAPAPGSAENPLGKPFYKRLVPSATSYTVPAKNTLSVTDIIFENPAAEHGTLQLKRSSEVLLSVNLDNFRDLDYHFVAPLTFVAGDNANVTFSCSPSCPNAAILLDGYQKANP